jgi:phage terminase small subunit
MSASPWPKPQPVRNPVTRLAPPPSHIEPVEAALFRELVKTFAIDDAGSISLLTTAMEAHQRMRHARERIDKDGEVINGRFDQLVAHPAVAIERDARDAFLRSMRALNLKPTVGKGRSTW